jgi:hypothetical protein
MTNTSPGATSVLVQLGSHPLPPPALETCH